MLPTFFPLPLRASRFRLIYIARQSARLPNFMLDRWRGAFGRALQELSCPLPSGPSCASCPMRSACPYATFFEDKLLPTNGITGRISSPPRPWALEHIDYPPEIQEGDTLNFELVLFGTAIDAFVQFLSAFQRAGERGIQYTNRYRLPLSLIAIEQQDNQALAHWHQIFDGHRVEVISPGHITLPPISEYIRIKIITPLSLKLNGRLAQPSEFNMDLFRRRLRRRILDLVTLYEPSPNHKALELIEAPRMPEGIIEIHDDLHLESVSHVSSRACRRKGEDTIRFSGLMGSIEVRGNIEPLWPTLWLGSWTHAGNESTMGLGQYQIFI